MRDLKTLIPYMAKHWPRLLGGGIMNIVATIFALALPFLIGNAIDKITDSAPQSEVTWIAVIIVVLALLGGITDFFARYLINAVSRDVEYALRNDFFAHLQTMHQGFFQNRHTGDIMALATNDMSAVRNAIGPGISNGVRTVLMFTLASALMISINAALALVLITFIPIVAITFWLTGKRMHNRFEAVQSQFGKLSTYAQENFAGIRVVKAYAQENYEIEHFAKESQIYQTRSIRYQTLNQLLWPLMGLVLGVAAVAILFVGGNEVINKNITIGQFVQFNSYLFMLSWPMIALGWVVSLYQQGTASMGRIREMMGQNTRIADTPETVSMDEIQGDIEFDKVSLSYEGNSSRKVLDEVSFHAPAGTSLAIVGATGAGKTSIINLITRVYEAQKGRVLVDGVDVRRIPLAVLRRNIGLVPQDTFLFSSSLDENVAFGVDEDEIDPVLVGRAVETARLSNDLDQFPEGIQTIIGERGVTLSGGQKQRTALARAIMRDPAILILDDSLSSIDTQTQAQILAGLRTVLAGRTSIIISQRISTVKDANQIIVLDDGQIIERGTHSELVALRGVYASMYRRELLSTELGIE
ncbi:MAG TPA: ABC transporter ATP-binding protein [Chloroflexia bacterium]|nr:ABC transporter ATP-binding protein [Chloroflexia bacterium]